LYWNDSAMSTDFRIRFQGTGTPAGPSGVPAAIPPVAITIADATITDESGAAVNLTNFPNRIVKGTFHTWMQNGSTPINAIRARISVKVQFSEYDVQGSSETDTTGTAIRKSTSHEFHCDVTLTNSPAGITTYNGLNINQTAELAATGLAQNIYTSLATLDYDGEHEIVDPGIPGSVAPLAQILGHWNVLNLSGGATAWTTANITIAGTDIDLMTNHQRIEFGPSKHLSPQDWSELLTFFRNRFVFQFAGARATGYGDQNAAVDMAHNTPDGNTMQGLTVEAASINIAYATEGDPTTAPTGVIDQDSNCIAVTLAATTPTPVES
jgi:hypothetical protein